jgi:hypothetical protein
MVMPDNIISQQVICRYLDGRRGVTDEPAPERRVPESLVTLVLALVITVVCSVISWQLASGEFTSAPTLSNPGTIFVATLAGAGGESSAPINVEATYGGATGSDVTRLQISLTQVVPDRFVRESSPDVLVALCGPIAARPRFTDNHGRPVTWHQASLPQGEFSSLVGTGSDCVYTITDLNITSPPQKFRQALLLGSSRMSASRLSGDQILYALPGVEPWPPYLPTTTFTPSVLPRGSSATVSITGARSDLENVTASPQLPDSGTLQWSQSLNPVPTSQVSQYRLSGQFADIEATAQRNLFLAGALVGVAGAALIWLAGALVTTFVSGRRKKHHDPDSTRPSPPEPDAAQQDGPAARTLERLKILGDAASLQEIYAGLNHLGYEPHSPRTRAFGRQPEPYLRWTDPGRRGPAVIYCSATDFWFTRNANQPANGPTAANRQIAKIPISGDTARHILQAAQKAKHRPAAAPKTSSENPIPTVQTDHNP